MIRQISIFMLVNTLGLTLLVSNIQLVTIAQQPFSDQSACDILRITSFDGNYEDTPFKTKTMVEIETIDRYPYCLILSNNTITSRVVRKIVNLISFEKDIQDCCGQSGRDIEMILNIIHDLEWGMFLLTV